MAQTYLIWELLAGKGFSETWQAGFLESIDCYFSNTRDPGIKRWHNDVTEDDRFKHAMSDFTQAQWDMNEFNPFKIVIRGSGGYCLLTLQIAVWSLFWSLKEEALEAPKGFPEEVFEAKGPSRLAWVAMIGHDADTYGAAAGPLIIAAHKVLPSGLIDGLKAVEI